jgi:hypothetical protein
LIFQQCEAHSSKRFSFKDLLIRPVQRLPSVSLLLKELQKATNKHNPDFSWLKQALDTIDEVLKRSNDSREMTDNHSNTLEVANRIESFPVSAR